MVYRCAPDVDFVQWDPIARTSSMRTMIHKCTDAYTFGVGLFCKSVIHENGDDEENEVCMNDYHAYKFDVGSPGKDVVHDADDGVPLYTTVEVVPTDCARDNCQLHHYNLEWESLCCGALCVLSWQLCHTRHAHIAAPRMHIVLNMTGTTVHPPTHAHTHTHRAWCDDAMCGVVATANDTNHVASSATFSVP